MTALRVLVVEDEAHIALMIEGAVEAAGHIVARTATNIRDAMAAAASDDFDVALLDLNLNGQRAHAVPVTLAARGKPFGFVTGYGEAGVLEPFTNAPLIAKPFRTRDIREILGLLQTRL
jgi:DNA-binding NtrC family response regulator